MLRPLGLGRMEQRRGLHRTSSEMVETAERAGPRAVSRGKKADRNLAVALGTNLQGSTAQSEVQPWGTWHGSKTNTGSWKRPR